MSLMPESLLTLDGLGRRFGEAWVFQALDWKLSAGKIALVTGPNGSGKTTLFKVLTTLLTPSAGDASVDGFSVKGEPGEVRKRIAWVPATDGGFFPRLTGRENLRFHASLLGLGRREADARMSDLAGAETLRRSLDTPYFLGSAGMRQMLHIARGWLSRPRLLILDEPTRSLDGQTKAEVLELMSGLADGASVLLSSHSPEEWQELSGSVLSLGGTA
jgi:ABC-type multidrug transport system ATPase subunit